MALNIKNTLILLLILALVAAFSFFWLGDVASSPEVRADIVASIDRKIDTVLKLTASSTMASVGVSMLPEDWASPIAEELADFSTYFMLVLCVLYTERFLLGFVGTVAFKYLVPIACGLYLLGYLMRRDGIRQLSVKIAIIGVTLFFAIPASLAISDSVYESYESSINSTILAAEQLSDGTEAIAESKGDQNLIQRILATVSDTATNIKDWVSSTLNSFVRTLAILLVTDCLIPLLGLLFIIWVVKLVTGVDLNKSIKNLTACDCNNASTPAPGSAP